jgi:DNA-binding response OmpR family regulator
MAATVRALSFRDGVVDFVRREIPFDDGERNPMSQLETALLHHFAANAGRVISRDEILSQVWRLNPARVITRTIDSTSRIYDASRAMIRRIPGYCSR